MKIARGLGILAVLALLAVGTRASAADSADECVNVTKTMSDDGLDFEVANHCDRSVTCSIRWTLACENDSGKTTSTKAEAASFALGKDVSKHASGSAKSCKNNWRIDDIDWSCAPATK